MIKLEKLTQNEVNNKAFLIDQIFDLYGGVPGEFYSYRYENEERWLYRDELYCTILGIDGEYIVYTSFMVDEDYDLSYMEFDNFSVAKNINGEKILYREGNPIMESLTMKKRLESANNNDFDGIITHHLINSKSREEVLITYKAIYRDNPHYYQSLFHKPFIISFINNGKIEQYMLYDTSIDYISYDIITIKEFGLIEFMKNGSYSLQKNKSITRYFKIKKMLSDGTCILLYPFSKAYTGEDMKNMLKLKGFTGEVDDYMLNYYNENYLECAEYRELAKALMEYDKTHTDDKKLVKNIEGSSDSN